MADSKKHEIKVELPTTNIRKGVEVEIKVKIDKVVPPMQSDMMVGHYIKWVALYYSGDELIGKNELKRSDYPETSFKVEVKNDSQYLRVEAECDNCGFFEKDNIPLTTRASRCQN